MNTDYDIAIIGAGPSGLSFARALSGSGLKIVLIEKLGREKIEQPAYDGREIALTHRSREIMKELGQWDFLPTNEVAEIKKAQVVNGDSLYRLNFDPDGSESGMLGWMVSNHHIRKASWEALNQSNEENGDVDFMFSVAVDHLDLNAENAHLRLSTGQEITARLVVAADSRFSAMRRAAGIKARMLDFGRTCIVCRMEYDGTPMDTAYECFHYDRTLAILPLFSPCCSAVITVDSCRADEVLEMDAEEFARDIEERVDHAHGTMKLVSERFSYPLVGVYASRFYGQRMALIGDAAVGMHPVTAHGYNLGLGSADILAGEIKQALNIGQEISSEMVLRRYDRRHSRMAKPIYEGTNMLVQLYTDTRPPAKFVRHALLRLGNHLHPARKVITGLLTRKQS